MRSFLCKLAVPIQDQECLWAKSRKCHTQDSIAKGLMGSGWLLEVAVQPADPSRVQESSCNWEDIWEKSLFLIFTYFKSFLEVSQAKLIKK